MTHTASSTADRTVGATVPKILVVGGGYAGFYTAWKLEKHLRKGEAEVTIVDPLPYMTYQPFLPEVAALRMEADERIRNGIAGRRREPACGVRRGGAGNGRARWRFSQQSVAGTKPGGDL